MCCWSVERQAPSSPGVIDRVWEQLPGPRARAVVHFPGDVDAAVARAILDLQDVGAQRADAQQRGVHPDLTEQPDDAGDMDHEGMDHSDMDHDDDERQRHGP